MGVDRVDRAKRLLSGHRIQTTQVHEKLWLMFLVLVLDVSLIYCLTPLVLQ